MASLEALVQRGDFSKEKKFSIIRRNRTQALKGKAELQLGCLAAALARA